MRQLIISFDENGRCSIKTTQGVSFTDSLAFMEIAKHILLSGNFQANEEVEVVDDATKPV